MCNFFREKREKQPLLSCHPGGMPHAAGVLRHGMKVATPAVVTMAADAFGNILGCGQKPALPDAGLSFLNPDGLAKWLFIPDCSGLPGLWLGVAFSQ